VDFDISIDSNKVESLKDFIPFEKPRKLRLLDRSMVESAVAVRGPDSTGTRMVRADLEVKGDIGTGFFFDILSA
jgi:hypothetical protein